MNTKLIVSALSLTLSLTLPAAYAQDKTVYEEQKAGIGIGFVIGAAVGGPIGAMAASFIGNSVGESVGEGKADKREIVLLRESLLHSEGEIARVKQQQIEKLRLAQQQLNEIQQRFVAKQRQYEQKMAAFHQQLSAQKSLVVALQFRTGSSTIEPVYQQQLVELAKTMGAMQGYGLDLSGYADRQGEQGYNQQLSQQRANSVKQFLVSQGIAANRIATTAFGESQPLQATQSLESDFFDRRVILQLTPTAAAVAKND